MSGGRPRGLRQNHLLLFGDSNCETVSLNSSGFFAKWARGLGVPGGYDGVREGFPAMHFLFSEVCNVESASQS